MAVGLGYQQKRAELGAGQSKAGLTGRKERKLIGWDKRSLEGQRVSSTLWVKAGCSLREMQGDP